MSEDKRLLLKQWLASGKVRLQPLTFPQRELWEASPVPVADMANHICCLIHVKGALTAQECDAAIKKVVERQEVLRLSFLPGKEQPVQMIRDSGEPQTRFRELSSSQAQPESVEEIASEVFHEPFDLVQGSLYRLQLLRRASDDHVLVFSIHHAIADGWTLGVFVQELCIAYVQGLRGIRDPLPPVDMSYSAWGAAERAYWQPSQLESRAAFWKANLAGSKRLWPSLEGPATASGAHRRVVTYFSKELADAARELARRSGATLYSTLLSAFQVALSQWSKADDIVVGTPVANRTKKAAHETMGYFAGIVPIRGRVDRDRSFSAALASVHQNTVDSFANAMPFAELARALGETSAPGHNPIFEVRFALQNHPVPDVSLPTLSARLRMRSTGTARYHLACEITEEGERLEVVWLFRPSLFPQVEIDTLSRIFENVLTRACRSPQDKIAALLT